MMHAKKPVSVLLSFALVFCFCPITPAIAATVDNAAVSDWTALQDAINSSTNSSPFVLTKDIVADESSASLKIADGKSHAIDLNGHTIDRHLSSQANDSKGHVIDVSEGTLTIKDSSAKKSGAITGGYAKCGGGIVIGSKGVLEIESGIITGNYAQNGGGIYVEGELTMTGGSITENVSDAGGGVWVSKTAKSVNVGSGVIVKDNAPNDIHLASEKNST